ncbi:Zn-dependent alcohol dehydrogenase [Ruegeria arenilitoris]|uniref:Zn-dependent alcohol dehydrogenase n=1 Tax=Ruegeria arenilitoris TaxID=1173585 RepID=UPI00148016A7|nr:Zn-dependent alcohol dehydrogenase [Ruegeria arenilitoris]
MKAAVLYEPNTELVIENISIRKPVGREVLVKTVYAGLCHSDLHFIEGLYPHPVPLVPGHEAAGVVEAVGPDVTYVKPGDHVITCLAVFCGTCETCLSGKPAICSNPEVRPEMGSSTELSWEKKPHLNKFLNLSSFAEQMLVHENALAKIRKDMPLDRAALIGCGVLTGFGAVVNTAQLQPGESVAVIGCGGVGMAAVNGAWISGAGQIIAIDTNPDKRQLASKLGATVVIDPSDGDIVAQVLELAPDGVHHAIECLGLKSTAEQAFRMTARGGGATIVGMVPYGLNIEVDGLSLLYERRLQGSFMGGGSFRTDMPRLIELYLQNRLKLDEWISERISLEEINRGFAAMKAGTGMRSVIEFR